ncbi:MAG TPA: BMC domain-containing protein [Terriglobales bacterium]|nr:BMC domain-containing protein [Terriglobales bacterium]
MREALGLVEVQGWSPAMAILDAMEKAASIRLLQAELNDLYGVCLRITGALADVGAALDSAAALAQVLKAKCVTDLISAAALEARAAYEAHPEFNPLIEQNVVYIPPAAGTEKEKHVSPQSDFAIGFIETQGFTAVIEAIDTACKAASVEVLGREKLGGGYITVVIKGDVAAVNAAIEAGKAKVDGLGKLIAAHVIPRPSRHVLALLPTPSA